MMQETHSSLFFFVANKLPVQFVFNSNLKFNLELNALDGV